MAGHDRVRFELSPTPSSSLYAPPFEVEGRKRHKGKAKSLDHRLVSPPAPNSHPLPTQQAKLDPSEESPVLVSHFDHHSPPSRQRAPTPAPPSGLKLHFENTNQPLDAYELTQTYLREYAQGVVDGQLMAGKSASWSSTSQQPRASTSRSYSDVSLHDGNESTGTRSVRSTRSAQNRGTRSVSGPTTADTHSRPAHQRQSTAPSIATSVETSSTRSGSQTRSRSRSRPRPNQINHPINHPNLADLLSSLNDAPSAPRRPVTSLPTSPPILNPNLSPIPSLLQPSHGQPLEPSIQSNLARAISPAPSMVSKASTWGTFISSSTNLTTYSSMLDIRNFRSYPRTATLDGINTWPSTDSPAASVNNAASPPARGPNGSRIDPRRSSQYSITSWHGSAASSSPLQTQDQFSSSNSYRYEGENENVERRDELLNPSYSRDSTGRHPRLMEPQRIARSRNQPLPALSPSFPQGETIFNEAEDRSDPNFMSFGNALGLELSTGPQAISAPTPVVPHRTFLRSFSDETWIVMYFILGGFFFPFGWFRVYSKRTILLCLSNQLACCFCRVVLIIILCFLAFCIFCSYLAIDLLLFMTLEPSDEHIKQWIIMLSMKWNRRYCVDRRWKEESGQGAFPGTTYLRLCRVWNRNSVCLSVPWSI